MLPKMDRKSAGPLLGMGRTHGTCPVLTVSANPAQHILARVPCPPAATATLQAWDTRAVQGILLQLLLRAQCAEGLRLFTGETPTEDAPGLGRVSGS